MTSAAPSARPLLTVEEYRARERRSDVRHEYVDGRVYAMSGESRAHNQIAGNVYVRLRAAARGGPCRVWFESVRLVVNSSREYYPDVVVACGPAPDDPYFEDAPCVVVEVLSPSTRNTDRRDKGPAYRANPALRMYLIVDQPRRRVEWYSRAADGAWQVADLAGNGTVTFPYPAGEDGAPVSMTFDEIYEGVEPPPEHPTRRSRAR